MAELRLTLAKGCLMAAVLSAVALGASLPTAPAIARTPFDGTWSVLIVTDAGNCDRAYRYALRIQNGRVSYNDSSFDISGRVDARGHVHVSVNYGQQHASGTGQLSADHGQGRWSGSSSTSQCSGHWEAERRG
jgi:outer membrane protein assembly factor BamB